jgi:hypothetical protein
MYWLHTTPTPWGIPSTRNSPKHGDICTKIHTIHRHKKSIITTFTVRGDPTKISKIRYSSSVFCGMADLTMTPTGHPEPQVKQEQFRGKIENTVPG